MSSITSYADIICFIAAYLCCSSCSAMDAFKARTKIANSVAEFTDIIVSYPPLKAVWIWQAKHLVDAAFSPQWMETKLIPSAVITGFKTSQEGEINLCKSSSLKTKFGAHLDTEICQIVNSHTTINPAELQPISFLWEPPGSCVHVKGVMKERRDLMGLVRLFYLTSSIWTFFSFESITWNVHKWGSCWLCYYFSIQLLYVNF